MNSRRSYNIVTGSRSFFEEKLNSVKRTDVENDFLEIVKLSDNAQRFGLSSVDPVSTLIIKNSHYHGLVDSAHDRIESLIEEFTTDNAEIYIHNPPKVLHEHLLEQRAHDIITLNHIPQKYLMECNSDKFSSGIKNLRSSILGQDDAINEISKSLWYLAKTSRSQPYVIMLYGNSGLGKTDLVRNIAKNFFRGEYFEKHLSMFKNNNYAYYFFGESPNRRSLGYDLLERKSNLIFFDEIDKCPDYYYSAFYTLFDNARFDDANYAVDVSGSLIILTSNYKSEKEIHDGLGFPIFCRIDKIIHFDDFSPNIIHSIVENEIRTQCAGKGYDFDANEIYSLVSRQVKTHGENARTIRHKVQQGIEELLSRGIL